MGFPPAVWADPEDPVFVPGDWNELELGQPIRVTVGGSTIAGEFVRHYASPARVDIVPAGADSPVTIEVSSGWSLFVVFDPDSLIPTMPGLYLDKDGDVWRLSRRGNWVPAFDSGNLAGDQNNSGYGGPKQAILKDLRASLRKRTPFRRLEVRADTVAATLAALNSIAGEIPTADAVVAVLERDDLPVMDYGF
jgi:hypothetical protein